MGFGEWLRRVWYLLNRRRLERDLQREMEIHRAQMAEPRGFGNTLRLREESNDAWGWRWLDEACRDLRFAARTLRQSPGFTIGASLVLALGIGLNLTLFQIYNETALRPLNVRDIETLVRFQRLSNRGQAAPVPYPATQYVRTNNTVLSAVLVAARYRDVQWNDFENRLAVQFVSTNWFDETGYNAVAGRLFHETIEETPGAQPAVVISENFWTNRLNRDPSIVGSSVRINDRPATVVGVLPKDYHGLSDDESQVFLPIRQMTYFSPGLTFETAWDAYVDMYGRLKPGVPMAAARDSLRVVMDELAQQQPEHFKQGEWLEPYSAVTRFETPSQRQERLLAVATIAFLSLLVLTVACANLGNFVLSRAIGRLRELSIRIALGAGRWRVMRLLLAESALIAGIAAVMGLAISSGVFRVMNAAGLPPLHFVINWRTIIAAVAVTSFAMVAIGLLPTWAISRRDIASVMKDGGQTVSSGLGRTRLRSLLTAVQVGGSCIFLIFAGLMARSVQRMLAPGVEFEKVAVLEATRLLGRNIDQHSYWTSVRANVASVSETEDLALVLQPPPLGGMSAWPNLPEAPHLQMVANSVEPQYFNVMRVPIVAGRNFESSDDPQTTAIISRRLAMEAYGTLNVMGQQLPRTPWPNDKKRWTIVGVAEDAHAVHIDIANAVEVYFPLDLHQTKRAWLIVRARNDARLLLGPMRDAAQAVDTNLPVQARLMSDDFRRRLNEAAIGSSIALSLALATLLLACIGVFGVISYGASLRRKEISIRLALGAKNRSLVALLMRQSGSPAAIGVLCGFGIAFAASKVLEAQRVYLGSLDAPLLLSVVAVIGVTCGMAALLPSVRALRTDVAQTLRDE